jgi:hypothetical protein
VADRDQMPDLWRVMGWLHEALDELRPVGADRSGRQRAAASREDGETDQESAATAEKASRDV